jgi:ribonuclease D
MDHPTTPLPENEIRLISSDAELQEVLPQLRQASELGADLEFDQNRHTYGFTLCLIQLSDGHTCYIIDPFGLKDLQPVFDLMEDPGIVKIFHHSNNDLLLFSKLGCKPRQILDTDVAAKIINYEKTSLASVMAEEFGVTIDKAMQASNWNRRPLTEEQIRYAALDVQYLRPLKERLVGKVKALGRLHWLEEEDHLLERISYLVPEQPHLRMKGISRFSPYELYILGEVYAFRESMAAEMNKPAGHIMSNEALLDLALHPDTDVHEWVNHTRSIHGRLKSGRYSRALASVLRQAREAADARELSQEQPNNRYRRPPDTPESLQREEEIRRLQEELTLRYGAFAIRMLLNQSHIQHYAQHGELIRTRQYAIEVINEVAAELGLDLRAQPPGPSL